MGIIRESFVIFKNWAEAIEALPDDYQLEAYKALVKYGLTGEIPTEISAFVKSLLISFSTGIEKSILRYATSVENGKLGGRPSKSITKTCDKIEEKSKITQENLTEPNQTYNNQTEPTPNLNDNKSYNKYNIKEINKEKNTILTDSELLSLIESEFKDKDVCEKFKQYALMRKGMGKNKAIRTIGTFESCIKKLRKYANTKQEALDVLDNSISSCYQGLFDIFKKCTKKTISQEAIPYAN